MKKLFILLKVVTLISVIESRLILLMDDKYEDCSEGGAKYVDYSGIDFDYVNDTNFLINGEIRTLKTIKSPWKGYYYIERFDRLMWHKALIDRHIPDFCPGLQNKNEPWYLITASFEQKKCPFEAGHVEKFNNMEAPSLPESLPFTLAGKYRAVFYSYFKTEKGKIETDCMRIGFDFVEH